jgi:hypothetical protein
MAAKNPWKYCSMFSPRPWKNKIVPDLSEHDCTYFSLTASGENPAVKHLIDIFKNFDLC